MSTRELRCDANPARLFAKIFLDPSVESKVVDGNLIEFACRDCRRRLATDQTPRLVLHRFNVVGDLVETEVVW